MRFRENSKRLIALFLALVTVLSIPISAGAISYDGTGTSGKGTANSSGTGAYGIYSTTLSSDLVGYRFTGIKADGSRAEHMESLDVIFNDSAYPNPDDNLVVMQPKYSKLEIYNAYKKFVDTQGSTLELSDYAVFGEVQAASVGLFSPMTGGRTIWESQLGLPNSADPLPKNATALGDWQKHNDWLDPIAKKVGYPDGIDGMSGGDKIIAEPLYVAKLEGKDHAVTPSELALYAALTMTEHRLDIMNDDGATYIADACPTFIRKYTNYWFPNSYRTPNGQGLWPAASALPAVSGDVDAAERATYGTILGKGYGVVIMYTDSGPALPDYYIDGIRFYDSSGNLRDPSALPLNTDIYVVVDYNCTTKTTVKGNLYFYNHGSGASYFSMDLENNGHTSWKVIKSCNYLADEGWRWQSKVAFGEVLSNHYGYYSSTSGGSRLAQSYGSGNSKSSYIIMELRSSTATCGYVAAQIQKAYDVVAQKDYPSAKRDHDANPDNNKMKIFYRFAKTISRDIEISSIVLKDENGTEYSNYKAIPLGATVRVFHKYKSNSTSGGISVGEPAVTGYAAGDNGGYYPVKINGESSFELETGYTYHEVGSFIAGKLIDQNIYGAIYITGDTARSDSDSPKIESTYNNNQKSTTWRAKCNIRLHQIIFHDGNGKTYKTKTYGDTSYSAPTFQVGQTVYITYVYKNTSGGGLYVKGTNTEGSACKKYKAPGDTSYTTNQVMYVEPGKTISVVGGSFTVKSGGGTVTGTVHVDKNSHEIPSSKSVSWYETNANDNTLSALYYAEDSIDLEIVKIQYKYTKNGESYTQTVNYAERNTKVVEIPYGVKVYVWYTYKNGSDKALLIDGYYCYNATGNPGTLISDTRTDYNANGVTLTSGATMTVCSGYFTASTPGTAYYYGAVFKDGKTDAIGEKDTTNNTMTAKYRVVGYDVAITDIYFKDAAGTEFSKGSDSAEMDYGKNYKIYYTIKNNSTSPIYVNVYNDIEPGNGIGVCVTPAAQATTGIRLEVGQSRDVYVGDWDAADQMIGVNPVGASVFLGTNTSATDFTYDDKTGTEINTTNNVREEDVTLKFDVAITNIYFTTTDGGIQMKPNANGVIAVPANVELICYYVLKNNTAAAIDVNIYYEANGVVNSISDGPKIKVITLAAGEEKTVVAGRMGFTINSGSSTATKVIKGHVYRDGQEIKGDSYEKTFDNNIYEVTLNIYKTPYLTAIDPHASYRVGTDVITSFYLHNPTTTHYTGRTANNTLKVTFTVKSLSGNVLYTVTQDAIVPALCEGTTYPASYSHGGKGGAQLVFFKWSVPEEYTQSMVVVEAKLSLPSGLVTTSLSNNRRVCSNEVMNTPDTQYEAKPPANWNTLVNASAPFSSGNNSRNWYVYTYTGGRFVRNYYYYSASAKYVYMNPISATTEYNGSYFLMRAGYGVKLTAYGIDVSKNATASMYTDMQYAYATWQEFGYSTDEGKITTLEKVGSQWQLPEYLDYVNDDGTGKRIHFTPIWYPNRDYSAYVCFSDIWTPMGMITAARETNEIQIRDDMYEDWYIGHG